MKLVWWVVAAVAACGPGLRSSSERQHDVTREAADALAAASQSGDPAAVRRLLGPSVMNGGIWFADPTCERELAAPGDIGGGRLDELARCLSSAKLHVSSRADSLADVAVLADDAGFELEAQFTDTPGGGVLTWIGWVARHDTADALPTIAPEALEALRTAGVREPSVSGLDASIATSHRKYAYAWVKLCIDSEGHVTGTHVRQASSTRALHAFTDAIADWQFKPFAPQGHALPVCSMMLLASPLATALAHEQIPMPMTGDTPQVAPDEVVRIAGERLITPDGDDKYRMMKANVRRVVGAFKVCIDTKGNVEDVQTLRSTGLHGYDDRIVRGIKQWRYQPFLDDGTPIAVCTGVNFIYSQR